MMKKSSINSKIEVTVVIVNYNTGKLLQECVDSIAGITNNLKSPKTEIIVVDNNSSDESGNIKGDVQLIKNNSNPGFSVANNQGIKKAKGEYVLLLNPDTEIKKDALQELLDFAKKTQNVGVVGAKLILPDGSTQKSVFRFPSIINAVKEFWFGESVYSSYAPLGNIPQEVDGVVGAAFLITPKALEKVGLLDEKYFMYFEDLDYCLRVHKAGLEVYYLPTAQVIHYHGVSGSLLAGSQNQWRRLIPSSKLYHGLVGHYVLNFIIWFGTRVLHRK